MNPTLNFEMLEYYFRNPLLVETRYENDANGNPIYIGISLIPNANPNDEVWYIKKIYYDGTYVVRTQIPNENIKLAYSWTQRATYFT